MIGVPAVPARHQAHLRAGRPPPGSAARHHRSTCGRARSSPWSASRAAASRPCCISPACWSGRTRATSSSMASRPARRATASARPCAARFLGFVYQYHHLLPEFSALENVMLPQMLNGRSRGQARPTPPSFWRWCSSRTAPTTGRAGCRAASSSAWRSRGPSPTRRACCWPTSRPATSISSTADTVFRQLLSLVRDTGMAALVATHNPDLAARMDRTVTLKDGF